MTMVDSNDHSHLPFDQSCLGTEVQYIIMANINRVVLQHCIVKNMQKIEGRSKKYVRSHNYINYNTVFCQG